MHIRIAELRNRKNTVLAANAAHGLTADELAQLANFDPAKMYVDGANAAGADHGPITISGGGETLAISDNTPLLPFSAKRASAASQGRAEHARSRNLEGSFPEHLPRRAYCSNSLPDGIYLRHRAVALAHRFISLNGPTAFEWMNFDVDRPGSYYAADNANLPPANVMMINPMNGHAHLAYLMARPVAKHSMARQRPLEYYASVERGFVNRLGADKHYCGLISKNPTHPDWRVEWQRNEPYTLDEMDGWLFDRDKRFDPRPETQFGAGRNVTTFDELRTFAYREVMRFKKTGGAFCEFQSRLEAVALGINRQFDVPLGFAEIRATVKSVAKWTWRRFSPEQFAKIQSHRGKAGNAKKWAGHTAESAMKPWEAMGISRATYYRRKAAGAL